MATTVAPPTRNIGKVIQVIGPVLDVEFEAEKLPEIYNALRITAKSDSGTDIDVTSEVQQHIGRNQVRAVAMSATDGVVRGMEVLDTGTSITVPVGEAALGRILNVLGQPVELSRTPSRVVMPPPEQGEHTDEVLAEFGFSAKEIATLRQSKVI